MTRLTPKLIQLSDSDKKKIDKIAKRENMTSNQLIRIIIKEFLKKEV